MFIQRLVKMLRLIGRPMSTSARVFAKADLNKALDDLVALKVAGAESADPEAKATASLINTFNTKYNPKTLTEEASVPGVGAPMPINAEMNYYAPLKHEVKHGDLKAEVVFKCFDPVNMEFFCDFALRAAYYLGLPATGPKPIPTKRERWTVIRAPFVMAKTKENFERKTHGRIIKIWDANSEVIDLWLAYLKKNSVWGVGVKVNMFTHEPLGLSSKMESISEGKQVLSGLTSTLTSLKKDNSNPVSQKVLELLADPVFAKHLTQKEIDQVKANITGSKN